MTDVYASQMRRTSFCFRVHGTSNAPKSLNYSEVAQMLDVWKRKDGTDRQTDSRTGVQRQIITVGESTSSGSS